MSRLVAASAVLAPVLALMPSTGAQAVPAVGSAQVAALAPVKSDRGSLRVVASGVPQGSSAKITVAGKGTRKKLPRAGKLRNLRPGTYRVWAAPIVANGGTAAVANLPVRVKVRKKKPAVLRITYAWNPKTDSYPPGAASEMTVVDRDLYSISLRWVNGTAPDLRGVEVRRKLGVSAPQSLDDGKVVDVAALGTSVKDAGLQSHTTYSYSVFMVDTAGNASRPLSVTTGTTGTATQITAGTSHTCALLKDTGGDSDLLGDERPDLVQCWGDNARGQLGLGTTEVAVEPKSVHLPDVVQVVAGADHTCARQITGAVWCWGSNQNGQLGLGDTQDRLVPAEVVLPDAVDISAGGDHTCAVLTSGAVRCWGRNDRGQLGVPVSGVKSLPVSVNGVSGAQRLTAGYAHTCAVVANGSVRCWGRNDHGQLGNNSTADSASAVRPALPAVQSVSAGVFHTCALLADQTVSCWGANTYGQIGDGTTTDRFGPVGVTGPEVTSLSAGAYHSCSSYSNGVVRCWGRNSGGRLGDGTTTDRLHPTRVSSLSGAASVTSGGYHSCALTTTTAWCWGANGSGQLGNATRTTSPKPVMVSGLS